MALSYFINQKKSTCVITFTGSLSPNDAEILSACLKEATSTTFRYTILNMGGVKDVDVDSSRVFTLFQQGLRSHSKLYLCDLLPEPGRILKTQGVVRDSETVPDLITCLQTILNDEKGR